VRKVIIGIAVSLAAASCSGAGARPIGSSDQLHVRTTASPYVRVTAGAVSGLVPNGWNAVPVDRSGYHEGFIASPHPLGAPVAPTIGLGISATWVDATRIGVPSDLYYLAATGPLLSRLQDAPGCRADSQHVFADHVPAFIDGNYTSVGDFVAEGQGICRADGRPATRWSYFIAAPGFGPAGSVGIPGSGLYVVVAMTRESPKAGSLLHRLLNHVRFGAAGIGDFERAVGTPLASV
jgi:hypothetical protein